MTPAGKPNRQIDNEDAHCNFTSMRRRRIVRRGAWLVVIFFNAVGLSVAAAFAFAAVSSFEDDRLRGVVFAVAALLELGLLWYCARKLQL